MSRQQKKNVAIVATIIVIVIITVAVAVAIALGVALGVSDSDSDRRETCDTESCVELTDRIMTGLDSSVDPCEDFYQFSCGLWVNNTAIPEGM